MLETWSGRPLQTASLADGICGRSEFYQTALVMGGICRRRHGGLWLLLTRYPSPWEKRQVPRNYAKNWKPTTTTLNAMCLCKSINTTFSFSCVPFNFMERRWQCTSHIISVVRLPSAVFRVSFKGGTLFFSSLKLVLHGAKLDTSSLRLLMWLHDIIPSGFKS